MGHTDIMKIDDKVEFLRRMHQNILAKVYLKKGKAEGKNKFDESTKETKEEKVTDSDKGTLARTYELRKEGVCNLISVFSGNR